MDSGISIEQISQRMKAFRLGAGITPEELAKRTGVSRAAIYRYESGQPPRVDTLSVIAEQLGVSLTTLLGVGVEYISSSVTFFERMRQLEETVEQVSVLFGPISYLLTTDYYDELLPLVLEESIPEDVADREQALQDIDTLMGILRSRKAAYRERSPGVVTLVSAAELEQYLRVGFVGRYRPPKVNLEARREAARVEIEHIIRMLREQPIGTQIGVVVDSTPSTSFQVFKQADQTHVAVSPFRLGIFANIRLGVATITSAPEAVELYSRITNQLWHRSLKGEQAADFIETRITGR
jgi:transcriptional regulator with XRE-family HTH domain